MNHGTPFFKIAGALLALAASLHAQPAVTISVDTKNPGATIAPDFSGLSFEAAQLLPDTNGVHYFRPDNQPLLNLFHTLGIKSLRVGGNTSDINAKELPDNADLDSFFAFAKAAGVKVIYCLRLHNGDPQVDAQTAKYIMDHYADEMDCFSIGQEPSVYPPKKQNKKIWNSPLQKYQFPQYSADWEKFADALIAAVPDIRLCGPGVAQNGGWTRNFIETFGHFTNLVLITEHLYPGGSGFKVPVPEIGIDRMLANDSQTTNDFPREYQKLYDGFVPLTFSNGLPYRLAEANNFYNGGAANVSDTFASALWGLDFMYWWAGHGASGINFHTGDNVAAGEEIRPAQYTAYFTHGNGYSVRPLGYGIKAFDLGGRGKLLPLNISNSQNVNLSAYAVQPATGKALYVTIINKEHGASGRDADVTIHLNGGSFKYAEAISLLAPDNNAAATSGVTLGGAVIQNDGSWNGKWMPLPKPQNGTVHLKIPACSAIIVNFTPENYYESEAGTFTLPDPLASADGAQVQDGNDWMDNRRSQILKLYEGYIYGKSPMWRNMMDKVWDASANALGGTALRKQINLDFYNYLSPNKVTFHVLLYTPAAATNRVPVFLCLSPVPNYLVVNDPNVAVYPVWNLQNDTRAMPKTIERGQLKKWPVEEIIKRGYGIALVDCNEIEPDLADGTGWKYGVRSLYMKAGQTNFDADAWGEISAWAWGARQIMDYLEMDPNVDAARVAVVGDGRPGRAALWTGARDTRFAMVVSGGSGEMGAALARRDYGETIADLCKNEAYEFCPNFLDYSNAVDKLPVDSHMLLSLIAPRPLFLIAGAQDRWHDPRGVFEAAVAASPVYQLFGKAGVVTNFPPDMMVNGNGSRPLLKSSVLENYPEPQPGRPILNDLGFELNAGGGGISPSDWNDILNFADLHFRKGKPATVASKIAIML